MLKNYITDADLAVYDPTISKLKTSGQTSFANQIGEAFNLVLDDLTARGMDIRTLGAPIELGSFEGFGVHTGENVEGVERFNRFVVSGSVTVEPTVVALKGSRDGVQWSDVASITIDSEA